MNSLLNYLLEANIALVLLGLIFAILLRSETDFKSQRYFVLGTFVISLIVPLFPAININAAGISSPIPTIMLPAISMSETLEISNQSTYTITQTILVGYLVVALILLGLFISQIIQIVRFYKLKHGVTKNEKHLMIVTDGQFPTFSFFNLLFFDNSTSLKPTEKAKIVAHEQVHINQYHSIDIILAQLLTIVCWANPMAWWLKTEIQNIHEYIADEAIVKDEQDDEYTQLLARMALKKLSISLGNHFNKSITIKRIKMMKTPKTKLKPWKSAASLALVLTIAFIFGCNENLIDDVSDLMETSTMAQMPPSIADELAKLKKLAPDSEFTYMETDISNLDRLSNLENVDPQSIAYVEVFRNDDGTGNIGLIINRNGKVNQAQALAMQKNNDEVFTMVEEAPTPKGGMEALYTQIGENLVYPTEAKEAGVEGKVFVQFVVNENGELSDITSLRGIGYGCDEAAEAAVASSSPWNPGKQKGKNVKVRLILPITFKL